MKTVKTRSRVTGVKVLDKSVNLSTRMRDAFVRTKERAEETQNPRQASPAEYASDNIQATARGAAREIAYNPTKPLQKASNNLNRAKRHFQEAGRNLPKERRAAAERAKQTAAKARDGAVKLRSCADKAGEAAKEAKSAVTDAKQTLKDVRQSGRRSLRAAHESPDPKLGAKRDFIRDRARTQAVNARINKTSTRLSGRQDIKPDKQMVVNPLRGGDSPSDISRPGYMIAPRRSANSVGGAAHSAHTRVKKSVKTARRSAMSAVKTAKQTAKAAQKSARSAAKTVKTAERADRTARLTGRQAAKAAARTGKAAMRAAIAMIKAAIAAIKGLVAAIAAGGWVALLVILIICLIGALVGSVFGIFFSSEPEIDGGMTINSVIAEIDDEYTAQIDAIIYGNAYDLLDMSGTRASWKHVLAIYTVKTVSDPDNPMEVATIDETKAVLLRSVFWEMNDISYILDSVDVVEDVLDADGVPTGETATVTMTVLRITVTHKSTDDMVSQYGFSDEQNVWLDELLKPECHSMWNALLYGITSIGDGSLISIAETQLGNVGGEIYWSWYGFAVREPWCACFISWVAEQCGFLEAGILPRFSSCADGIQWFKNRNQWQEPGYTPAPGDLLFIDWEDDGITNHVGIVEHADATTVYTIEGNASDSVARRSYAMDSVKIVGYGTPEY
jgi:hypothetical protein